MTRNNLIITFCLLSFSLFGQNKFSFGINTSSEISFMKITQPTTLSLSEEAETAFGWGTGIDLVYNISSNIFFRTGFNYEESRHKYILTGLRFGSDIINGTESSIENISTISSVGIPLSFGYKMPLKNNKSTFLFGAGGQWNIILDTKEEAVIISESIPNEPVESSNVETNPSKFSGMIFLGMELDLSEKLVLGFESYLKYTPNLFDTDLFSNSEAETLMEIGLAVRLRFQEISK